jgi:hypothetical protein
LVALTDGVGKLRKLTWNGSSRNAPDRPAMEQKMDTQKATSGGIKIEVSTWETGNLNAGKSTHAPMTKNSYDEKLL